MPHPFEEIRKRLHSKIARLPLHRLEAVEALFNQIEDLPASSGSGPQVIQPSGITSSPLEERLEIPQAPHDWPRAPLHRLSEHGTYFVTCGTLDKEHVFRGRERLDLLQSSLVSLADQYGWQLEAWAVFSNHYHFVAHSRRDSIGLRTLLKHLHGDTARIVNQLDDKPLRQVWHNFWDTRITFEKSYLARLHYVHQNPVRHGLVRVANRYPWCSAAWFERTASPAQVQTIYRIKIDRVNVPDAFEPEGVLDL